MDIAFAGYGYDTEAGASNKAFIGLHEADPTNRIVWRVYLSHSSPIVSLRYNPTYDTIVAVMNSPFTIVQLNSSDGSVYKSAHVNTGTNDVTQANNLFVNSNNDIFVQYLSPSLHPSLIYFDANLDNSRWSFFGKAIS